MALRLKLECNLSKCEDFLPSVKSNSISLLLQDPPFGVTKNKWDKKPVLLDLWPEWIRIGTPNCAFLFFATQPFAAELIQSAPKLFRYDLIWEKTLATGHLNANKMPMRAHESILVFYRNLPTYNPQKTTGHTRKVSTIIHKRRSKKTSNYGTYASTNYDSTERFPRSVLKFATDKQKSPIHPTQKPVELLRYLVRTYSNPGDTVYDGYLGSGTTAVACKIEGRAFVGCESNASIYKKAIDRLSNY